MYGACGTMAVRGRRSGAALIGVVAGAACWVAGCSRVLTIEQDRFINTGNQIAGGLPAPNQIGEPLELTFVCVYPKDLDNPANARLKPNSHITADEWYKKRPLAQGPKDAGGGRFEIPFDQVYVMTDEDQSAVYGEKIGNCLRGAQIDGAQKAIKQSIHFDPGYGGLQLHNKNSVIYVFPKFYGKVNDKNVVEILPVPPVVINPPGDYSENLTIKVGVREPRTPENNYGQYIENKTKRAFNRGAGKSKSAGAAESH